MVWTKNSSLVTEGSNRGSIKPLPLAIRHGWRTRLSSIYIVPRESLRKEALATLGQARKSKREIKIKRLGLRWLHDRFLRTPKKREGMQAAMASRDGHRHLPLPAPGAASANGHGDTQSMDTNTMITETGLRFDPLILLIHSLLAAATQLLAVST